MPPSKKIRYTHAERKEKILIVAEAIKNMKGCVAGCKEAGIPYETFLYWRKKYPDLLQIVKDASAVFEHKGKEYAAMQIFKHMDKSWLPAAWWLERKHPDEFAMKNKAELSGGYELRIRMNYGEEEGAVNINGADGNSSDGHEAGGAGENPA